MATLISVVNAAIEDAVNTSVLPNSKNGTVRNISSAITKAVEGDSRVLDAVKAEVASFYAEHPLDSTAQEVVAAASARIVTAVLVARESEPVPEQSVREKRIVETPSVESLSEALVSLGRTAESAPEAVGDEIVKMLRRFGLD